MHKRRIWNFGFVVLVMLLPIVLIAGCATKAEKEFVTADVRIIGMYVARAQEAVEMYCKSLEAADYTLEAQKLRVDTEVLANEITANAKLRLDKLRADAQAVQAARKALNLASAVLDSLEIPVDAPPPQGPPANKPDDEGVMLDG